MHFTSFTSLAPPLVIVSSAGGSGSLAEMGHAVCATFTLPAPENFHSPPEVTLVGEVVMSAEMPWPAREQDLAFLLRRAPDAAHSRASRTTARTDAMANWSVATM